MGYRAYNILYGIGLFLKNVACTLGTNYGIGVIHRLIHGIGLIHGIVCRGVASLCRLIKGPIRPWDRGVATEFLIRERAASDHQRVTKGKSWKPHYQLITLTLLTSTSKIA